MSEEEHLIYPSLNGDMIAHEGDGVVPSRPYSTRKSVIEKTSFAIAASAVPGVVVNDNHKPIVVGNMNLEGFQEQANRVYDPNGVAPTIPSSRGGTPAIRVAGDLNDPHRFRLANVVLDPEGISTTLNANGGGGIVPKIEVIEDSEESKKIILAGELTNLAYDKDKRIYDPNGIAPSVLARDFRGPAKVKVDEIPETKDVETEVIKAGELDISDFVSARNVYDPNGVAPTLVTTHTGIGQHKIVLAGVMTNTEYVQQKRVYSPDGVGPCVLSRDYKDPPKIEVVGNIDDTTRRESENRVYSPDGIAPAILTSQSSGISKIEINNDRTEKLPKMMDGDVCAMLTPGREKKRQNGPRFKDDGTAFALTCQDQNGIAQNEKGRLRIRYLTPRETWRLQGFPDEAYDKAVAAGTSKTQLYKQSGNSIAVPCLYAIFRDAFVNDSFVKEKTKQCKLEVF